MEDFQKFLDPQTLASLQGLDLQARMVVEGYVAGLHKSPYHGFSVEFAQHREYAPGDDVRHVDWKVWSKTDKLYLKQYEEETNLLTYLLLDTSDSMSYAGEDHVTKFQYAQFVAASLAYLVLQQQDSVGLVTFDDQVRRVVRPSGQPSHLRELLQVMAATPTRERTEIGPVLHDTAERLKKRGVVALMSDLLDDVDSVLSGLRHLRHRRHEVIVFHILDRDEVEFPFRQVTKFLNLELANNELLTDPAALRRGYLQEFENYSLALRKGCRLMDIDYVPLTTDEPLDAALTGYLTSRATRLRRR